MAFIKKKIIIENENIEEIEGTADQIVDAGIEKLVSDAENGTEESVTTESSITEESERFYNWLDVSEILSEYLSDEAVLTMNSLMANQFKDKLMSQSDLEEILADLPDIGFTPDQLDTIKVKISNLSDPSKDIKDQISSDLNVLEDIKDKLLSNEIKEKIIDLISEFKNE